MARHTPVRLRQPSAHRHGHRVCRGREGPERNLVGFSEDILRSEVDADQSEHRYGDKCERYAFDPDHESVDGRTFYRRSTLRDAARNSTFSTASRWVLPRFFRSGDAQRLI